MLPSAKKVVGRKWVFQHDNDPKHTSNLVKQFLATKKINVMEWPAMSPDLNPIEQIWGELKKMVKGRNPRNINTLKVIIEEEWNAITPALCDKYVQTMKSRLQAVIDANGGHTKY